MSESTYISQNAGVVNNLLNLPRPYPSTKSPLRHAQRQHLWALAFHKVQPPRSFRLPLASDRVLTESRDRLVRPEYLFLPIMQRKFSVPHI